MIEARRARPTLPRLARLSLNAHERTLSAAAAVLLFLLVWQIVGASNLIRSDLISYPTEILATTAAMAGSGELASNAAVSLLEFMEGFVPAIVVGAGLGLALALNRPLRLLLDPLLIALYTAPRIAFIPILVVWFGVGYESKAVVVFLSAVFPIMINTTTGVEEVAEPWTRAVRAFGASSTQVLTKAILPGALPAIMTGIRLGSGRAIVGVIAAEMYVSVMGLGRLVQTYSSAGRAAQLFVLVLTISVFGFALIALIRWVEGRVGPWRLELEQ